MTMIPSITKAEYYNMKIGKDEDGLFIFELEERYDKDNKEHKDAFQNMEEIKAFHEQMLSTYGDACLEYDQDDMVVKLSMKAPFEKISNFIAMEFLPCGSLGKMTLLDFISMAASSMISNVIQNVTIVQDGNNEDMYI